MALSATVIPQIEDALRSFMHDPLVERSSGNHCNIYLAPKVCNFKRAEGSKQSVSLDSRDFNNFADLVKDLIVGECSIRFCLSCGSYCFSIKRPGHSYRLLVTMAK